jgi:NADH-quinone oxidoreductase subunit N
MRILNPSDATLPQLTGLLLILGLSLLLGAVPFQAWLGAVSAEAPPMVSAFVFSIASGVVLFKAFELFHRFPWLVQANGGNVLHLAALVGAASVIVGGVLAAFQRDFGKLLGWAVLVDTGFILIGLSSVSSEGLAVLALILLNRGIAVSLVGMGMGILRRERETDFFKAMTGIIWRKPFAVLGVTVGGLSLAGFPLTGGFTARWLAMQVLPASSRSWITLLILAGMAVSIGYLRGIAATTGESSIEPDEQEPLIVCVLILFLAVLTLVLALYPQLALQVLSPVMATLAIPR